MDASVFPCAWPLALTYGTLPAVMEGDQMDAVKVGKAIKTLRLIEGYTQHQLAVTMGVTDQAVSKWERGLSIPDVSIVTKLSDLLNIDVDTLLEGNIN